MAIKDIYKSRLKKLETLRKAGVNPYPVKTKRTHTIEQILDSFSLFSKANTKLVLAGRIRSIRKHGGSTFINFEDSTGKMQAYLGKDKIGKENYDYFLNNFDIGDIAEIKGSFFKTKKGEKTIKASKIKMLSKSLLPLPEKWHGLTDTEERFRKRYLDLIMNSEVRKNFVLRSKIIKEIRSFLSDERFLEVETPILQPIPGGALAKPFKTHLNVLNFDLYLRVSPELYLKKLLVGGFERIYEIGRCFRNEGMDKYHNPDFTMMELYWAYQDRDGLMKFVERFLKEIIKKTKKNLSIPYEGKEINFKDPWEIITFKDLVKKNCGLDIEKSSNKQLLKKLSDLGQKVDKNDPREILLDEVYKKTCRPNILQPTFVIDHPVEMAVLAKSKEGDQNYADRFQLIVGGMELINGFSELNDPIIQEKRFQYSKISLERRDKSFLEALEYAMPPAAGLGMGIDRLAALLTDSHSLREIILFPTMRPK